MATGSPCTTGATGPRPCPTPSWKEEELSGLGEGTGENQGGGKRIKRPFFSIIPKLIDKL